MFSHWLPDAALRLIRRRGRGHVGGFAAADVAATAPTTTDVPPFVSPSLYPLISQDVQQHAGRHEHEHERGAGAAGLLDARGPLPQGARRQHAGVLRAHALQPAAAAAAAREPRVRAAGRALPAPAAGGGARAQLQERQAARHDVRGAGTAAARAATQGEGGRLLAALDRRARARLRAEEGARGGRHAPGRPGGHARGRRVPARLQGRGRLLHGRVPVGPRLRTREGRGEGAAGHREAPEEALVQRVRGARAPADVRADRGAAGEPPPAGAGGGGGRSKPKGERQGRSGRGGVQGAAEVAGGGGA
ncbi:hypothetical protein ON010_g14027 [Phytophthora cinnamomi]|nr:hypothetical protein ON010_g14027 [Phytophthora cinnamomi]